MPPDAPAPSMPQSSPPIKLLKQIAAYRTSQCIGAVVELGIPRLLEQGPRPADELARAANAHPELLARVLEHLVNEEVFGRDEDGRYFNLPASRFLVPGHTHSLHPWVTFELDPLYWRAWERLAEQLRTNKPAFELAHGRSFFTWLAEDDAARKRFDDEMRAVSKAMGGVVVGHLRFPEGTTIVDVGGGDGSLLAQILVRNPGTKGLLFELPRADDTLDPLFKELMADGRASLEHGSFFEKTPSNGDAYIFSRVFHDFDDEVVQQILANTRAVMKGHERLFVVDIMHDPLKPKPGEAAQDILMLVLLGGRERTPEKFSELFASSGFATVSVTPTESPLSILEFAVPLKTRSKNSLFRACVSFFRLCGKAALTKVAPAGGLG